MFRLCDWAGPGGWRLWPQAGYWVADETATSTLPCAYPARARCAGWSIATGATTCGTGFDPSSPLCETCLPGYWRDGSGMLLFWCEFSGLWYLTTSCLHDCAGCVQCPTGDEAGLRAGVATAIAAAAVLLVCVLAVCCVFRYPRASVANALARSVRLNLWLLYVDSDACRRH